MLTVRFSHLLPFLETMHAGLIPLPRLSSGKTSVVVKASKEAILAAKLNKGFKVYAVPSLELAAPPVGLLSAFFDDGDEPLVLYTPLFEDEMSHRLRDVLLSEAADVYFFDEHNRELAGYTAELAVRRSTQKLLSWTTLPEFSPAGLSGHLDRMNRWFGLRSPDDDRDAIHIDFGASLVPDDLFIIDARPESKTYMGGGKVNTSQLERQNPGPFQEQDIALLLRRSLPDAEIYVGPLRLNNKKEVADILVLTQSALLVVQAKDSPNTAEVLSNPVSRKKATALHSLQKALSQISGALRYCRRSSPLRVSVDSKVIEIAIGGRQLRALVVVKELFSDEYAEYSKLLVASAVRTATSCTSLDYSELNQYTAHLYGEEALFEAFDRVFEYGVRTGTFPRLRVLPPFAAVGDDAA